MKSNSQHVVVGGGIAGLVAALLLSRRAGSRVTLVERSGQLGGLLQTRRYPGGPAFDLGMHFWAETGLPELDTLLLGLLPDRDWLHLTGSQRDCSGLFLRGRIQFHSQYADLRDLPTTEFKACVGDFFAHLNDPEAKGKPGNFLDHARQRFGPHIAEHHIAPIAEKIHGQPADQLHPMARFLPLLDRVVLFNEDVFGDLMQSDTLRARVAYPEQRQLPLHFSSGLSSHYPARYGIDGVIAAMRRRLLDQGVTLLTGTQVTALETREGKIGALTLSGQNGSHQVLDDLALLVWTGGQTDLARLLGLLTPPPAGPSRRTVVVNMLLRQPPRLGDLYCLFCAEPGFDTYRVTQYAAYCPAAVQSGRHPISMELIVADERCRDPDALGRQAVDEATRMGILADAEPPDFLAVEILACGFPCITTKAMTQQAAIRASIDRLNLARLTRAGILAEDELFFQKDILLDIHRKLIPWCAP